MSRSFLGPVIGGRDLGGVSVGLWYRGTAADQVSRSNSWFFDAMLSFHVDTLIEQARDIHGRCREVSGIRRSKRGTWWKTPDRWY